MVRSERRRRRASGGERWLGTRDLSEVGRLEWKVDPPGIEGWLETVSSSRARLLDATIDSTGDCEASTRRTCLGRKEGLRLISSLARELRLTSDVKDSVFFFCLQVVIYISS